jgi:hypothetical protein
MSHKLKALGLGLVAMMAVGALAVMNASASTGGHFTAPAHSIIKGTEVAGSSHQLEFVSHGLEGGIVCDEVTYSDYTSTQATETQVSVTPTYKKCHTTGAAAGTTTVHVNGCSYRFTVGVGATGTADVVCPAGSAIVITHPNCTITVPAQNNIGTLNYTTTTESGVHALTLDVNASFSTQYHGGICIFTGTSHTGTLSGSATVRGFDTNNNPVGITAT